MLLLFSVRVTEWSPFLVKSSLFGLSCVSFEIVYHVCVCVCVFLFGFEIVMWNLID